jgi:DNA (cytosine-5)-methyltransferase 1
MRIADLCCGEGGASEGLHQAFPDAEIVGVDIRHQPRYPFTFAQGNALNFELTGFNFVWASWPCQRYMTGGLVDRRSAPDLVATGRQKLRAWGGPYVMENVPGAPLRAGLLLCGSMFGLRIRRHRLFEANWPLPLAPASCQHHLQIVGVYGHPHGQRGAWRGMLPGSSETWAREMEIDWMSPRGLSQAVPPAYSRYVGLSLARANCGYV